MKLLLLHLSDIHFKTQGNPIMQKLPAIVAATRTQAAGINACIIAASGDIAFSGKQDEYKEAEIFFVSLRASLQEVLPNIPIHWAFIPGNHDCDHTKATSMRRMILKSTPEILDEIGKGDTSIVDAATEVQGEFFKFLSKLEPGAGLNSGDGRLKYTARYQINGESISLECYNTAWLSQLEEKQGKLFFPENLLRDEKSNSSLAISMFHHPYNWLSPDNARRFRKHVDIAEDIILTGHEHAPDIYEKTRVLGQVTHYVEGAVLQDSDENMSGYNVLLIDSVESKWICFQYIWKPSERLYSTSLDQVWRPFVRNKSRRLEDFEINDEFASLLSDPGAPFTHPRARHLRLEDIFVYLDIKIMEAESGQGTFLSGDDLLKYIQEHKQVFLVGDEKAGKTTLARRLFIDSTAKKLTPLIVDGADIRSANPDALRRVLKKNFDQEYLPEHFEKFLQGNPSSRLVIVDDFHECRLSPKAKAQFIKLLTDFSPNVLLLVDGSFDIETMMHGPSEVTGMLAAFRRCRIKELGHARRNEMIEKWCSIGLDDRSEDAEFTDRVRFIEKTMDTLKGKHLLPSHPIFVLTILQQIEAGTNLKTFSGAYGYIYEALITGSLIRADNATSLDTKYVFLSLLAFRAFTQDQKTFGEEDIDAVCDEYYKEYKIRIIKHDLLTKLQDALVLLETRGVYSFRYKYLFYYFVAKYFQDRLASNDNPEDLRNKLTALTTTLYNEDAANIIIFYIYLTKDQHLISQIISSAKLVFDGYELWTVEKQTKFLSQHAESAPQLEFDTARQGKKKQILRLMDEVEDSFEDKGGQDLPAKQERPPNDQGLDEMLQVNVALKATQIMGQILRNFPGSLKAETKSEIAKECILLSLRTLGIIFGQLEKHWPELFTYTEKALAEKLPDLDEEKLKQRASDLLLFIAVGVALGMVKNVSFSIGSDHLRETYKDLMEGNPTPEFALVDLAIKLDHSKPSPEREVAKLSKLLSDNWFGMPILRIMVLEYMHMFPCDFPIVQRLCHDVGIPIKQAILLESRDKSS